jgi:hypothetical protein
MINEAFTDVKTLNILHERHIHCGGPSSPVISIIAYSAADHTRHYDVSNCACLICLNVRNEVETLQTVES